MDILQAAYTQVGIREIPGKSDNEEILKYFHALGFTAKEFKDETAWCSAFMNYIAKICGKPFTGKLNARSWLDVGLPVVTPQPGDVVIFWRENPKSWKGHVGIFIAERDNQITVLGGNQGNEVGFKKYDSDKLLGYRRL